MDALLVNYVCECGWILCACSNVCEFVCAVGWLFVSMFILFAVGSRVGVRNCCIVVCLNVFVCVHVYVIVCLCV